MDGSAGWEKGPLEKAKNALEKFVVVVVQRSGLRLGW